VEEDTSESEELDEDNQGIKTGVKTTVQVMAGYGCCPRHGY